MAAWKRSGRDAATARRRPAVPRLAWIGLGGLAAAIYGVLFLRLPIAEGVMIDGVAISRAGFVIGSLLYPEDVVDAWFGQGQLAAGFVDRLPIAIGTVLWLALALAIGLPLVAGAPIGVPARGRGSAGRVERFALAMLAGLALLSTVTLLVGLAGGLHSRVPLAVGVGALAMGAYGWARLTSRRQTLLSPQAPSLVPDWLDEVQGPSLLERACGIVTVAIACWSAMVLMLGAWVPASEFDVLEYHLQAPKEFFELGRIQFLPHNIYANMPLGTEMHSLAMMTLLGQSDPWLGGLIGKSITAAFSLIGAALLGGYLAQRFGTLCGWWAAGLWLATPGIAQVATLGLIDGALATYVLAAAVCAARAIESGRLQRRSDPPAGESKLPPSPSAAMLWWGLGGVMSGAAAAAKYPGLIFAVAPLGAVFLWAVWLSASSGRSSKSLAVRSVSRREQRRASAFLICGLLATCAPWYAKNWVLAGNPVYPLAASVFGGKTLTAAKIEQWRRAHRVPASAPAEAGPVERVGGIVRVAAQDAMRLVMASPYVQPTMICGVCIAVGVCLRRRNELGTSLGMWLGWSLWIVAVWWLATHRIDRFWLPLTGLWAALAAVGLYWVRSRLTPWLAYAIVIGGLTYGGLVNSSALIGDNRYFVSLAALRHDATSAEQVGRVPAEQAWINEHLAAGQSRVLLIGQAAVFEYRVPVLYSTCFDTNPGEAMLKGKSPAEQTATLHEHGITHIMIDWGEIARYRSPGNYGFSDWPQPADMEQMLASGVVSPVDWPIDERSAALLKVE